MKNIHTRIAALLLCLAVTLLAFSCTGEKQEKDAERMDLQAMNTQELRRYAALGKYTGIKIKAVVQNKGEAVWLAVKNRATVAEYPEQQVNYYVSQLEAQYKYYAEEAGVSYEEMLAEMGATEESVRAEAQEMAIDDIIFELVRRAENITLTEEEKESLFDKYVEKYVEDYGYSKSYVKKNMSELIYESMLYDKTTEFLITNNDFQ